jgi:hypothetical protein
MSPVSPAEYYEMSYAITRLLSESVDADRSMAIILEMLGGKLGWDLGSLWLVDDAKLVLRCRHFWHRTGAKEAPNFEKVSWARGFADHLN